MPSSTLARVSILVSLAFAIGGGAARVLAEVNGNSGAFTTSVPIALPSHRGLKPSLALSYHSSGGNAIAGVGWSLAGFSTIERQGRGP